MVLWHPDEDTSEPAEVAGLASTRTFPLRSSFAPSYNMTINLVHQMGPEQAHRLLERSFAQYQADRSVVGLVRGVERGERMLDEIAAELGGTRRADPRLCAAAREISERERAQARASRLQRRQAANDALAALRRGDIITITHGRRGGLAVVLEADRDSDDPRPLVLTENRWAGRISSADYSGASAPVGSMTLPKRVEHRQPRVRRDVASALRSAAAGLPVPAAGAAAATARDARRRPRAGVAARADAAPPRAPRRRPGGAGPGRRALPAHRARQRAAAEEGRRRHQLAGPHLRPDRGAAHRARVHRRSADGDPHGDRRRPAAGPDLQRERPSGRRMPAQRRLERAATPPSWPRWCRRCSTSRGAATARGRRERRGADRAVAAGAGARPAGCRRSCAPTSSGTASRRVASPTTASSPPSTAGPRTGDLAAALAAADAAGSGSPLSAGDFVRWCRQVLDLLDQVRNAAPTAGAAGDRETRDRRRFGAASSQLMPGRVSRSYGCARRPTRGLQSGLRGETR